MTVSYHRFTKPVPRTGGTSLNKTDPRPHCPDADLPAKHSDKKQSGVLDGKERNQGVGRNKEAATAGWGDGRVAYVPQKERKPSRLWGSIRKREQYICTKVVRCEHTPQVCSRNSREAHVAWDTGWGWGCSGQGVQGGNRGTSHAEILSGFKDLGITLCYMRCLAGL